MTKLNLRFLRNEVIEQVTISNLVVRLRRPDLIYMRDGDKTIYRSRDEFTGQKALFYGRNGSH